MRIDFHQHVWTESFRDGLEHRAEPPCLRGTLLEDSFVGRPNGGIGLQTVERPAGTCFGFASMHIYDVRHDGGMPAISLHAYSPALWRMGHYALGPHGLGRVSLTYVDEIPA